jgi:hypothetical protein
MQNGPMTSMSVHQSRPARTFSDRSKRRTTNTVRATVPNGHQSAQRNYERYLELARVESLYGDTVAAENNYQHAEHYFRLMSADTNR